MKFILLRRLSLMLGLFAILGVLAVACDEEEEKGPTPVATTPAATGTPAASPTPAAAKIGGAGIASKPRQVRGLEGILTLDDGLAAWKERPANEDRTGVTADTIKLGRSHSVTGLVASYEAHWGPTMKALFNRINEAGGIHGRKIELITRDDQYNPSLAIQVVRELVEKDKVFALLNQMGPHAHDAAAPYLLENKVPSWWAFSGTHDWFYQSQGFCFLVSRVPTSRTPSP